MVVGNNGVINKGQNAKIVYSESEDKSAIGLEFTACRAENADTLEVSETEFKNKLENNFKENIELDAIGDGSFVVTLSDSDKIYYVYEEGNVIGGMYDSIAINSVDDFKKFRDNVNNGESYENKYVYLTTDLNLGNEEWEPIGYFEQENSSMENVNNKPFSGVFNGNNHEITGLKINSTNKVIGLFGLVKDGQIKNIGIGTGCSIKGSKYESTLVGVLYNGKLYNCYNKSNITISSDNSGGIAGQVQKNSVIESCYNMGNITVSGTCNRIGGIVGCLKTGSVVKKSYNVGVISGSGKTVGGIVGDLNSNDTEVKECNNVGNITGNLNVGGIAGINFGKLYNCYNGANIKGTATSNSYIGGVVGVNNSDLFNCYNYGNITGADTDIGAIAGKNRIPPEISAIGYIYNSYSLENVCLNLVTKKDEGTVIENCSFVSSTDLKNYANKLGSEFKNDSENVNGGYPILNWQ